MSFDVPVASTHGQLEVEVGGHRRMTCSLSARLVSAMAISPSLAAAIPRKSPPPDLLVCADSPVKRPCWPAEEHSRSQGHNSLRQLPCTDIDVPECRRSVEGHRRKNARVVKQREVELLLSRWSGQRQAVAALLVGGYRQRHLVDLRRMRFVEPHQHGIAGVNGVDIVRISHDFIGSRPRLAECIGCDCTSCGVHVVDRVAREVRDP